LRETKEILTLISGQRPGRALNIAAISPRRSLLEYSSGMIDR
jgi:hypothetical protein